MFALVDRAVGSFANDVGFLHSHRFLVTDTDIVSSMELTSKMAEGTASFPWVVLICVKNACSRFPVGFSILGNELR